MDRLERKLSGAVFNASIPQPKCTEYSPPVHRFTLPAPEYRRSHVAVKFSPLGEGGVRVSGFGKTSFEASPYRARASPNPHPAPLQLMARPLPPREGPP